MIASIPARRRGTSADRLAEMVELLRTAGVEVAATVIQHRAEPDPRTYLGKGRIDESSRPSAASKPDVIVAETAS